MPTRILACVTAACLISACGGGGSGSNPTPVTTPAPTPAPPQVVLSGGRALAAGFATGAYFTTERAGTIEATVDYTFPTSTILVLIAPGQCTAEQFGADQCTYAATSFSGPKPRVLTVAGAAAGTYTLIIGNASAVDESFSVQVILRPSAASLARVTGAGTAVVRDGWLVPLSPQP